MVQYILALFFMIVVFLGMMLALTFSKYKRKTSGCCGGGHCDSEKSANSCYQEKKSFVENYSNKNY
jgi:hypothetical protein